MNVHSGSSSRHAALVLLVVIAGACGSAASSPSGGGTPGTGTGGVTPGTTGGGSPGTTTGAGSGVYSGGDTAPTSTGTIAYVRGNELRLIEPDGTGDQLVWSAPEPNGAHSFVTAPAWRPNGWEIAFAGDHELESSIFQHDLYAIRPDGKTLRKLTNAPTRDERASYPKGTVRVTVQNDDVAYSSFWVIAQGADAQPVEVPPGTRTTVTISGVADLGDGIQQPIVAAFGGYRWVGAGADVKAGQTVDAMGVLYLHASAGIDNYGAEDPFWRSDATKLGYIGPFFRPMEVSSNPPPGFDSRALLVGDRFVKNWPARWGPTAATADQLLVRDAFVTADTGLVDIVRLEEGATSKPAPLLSVEVDVVDLQWLADGSGFVFARRNGPTDIDVNVWEYRFATGSVTQVTNLHLDGVMRRFSMSPDGRRVAFEVVDRLYGDDEFLGFCDLWIMNRDGSGARLLAHDARYPAWNPTR